MSPTVPWNSRPHYDQTTTLLASLVAYTFLVQFRIGYLEIDYVKPASKTSTTYAEIGVLGDPWLDYSTYMYTT